eukprot:15207950-Alexandrium_andersonii.AAC.1
MSASLVGSEMCIRDRAHSAKRVATAPSHSSKPGPPAAGQATRDGAGWHVCEGPSNLAEEAADRASADRLQTLRRRKYLLDARPSTGP